MPCIFQASVVIVFDIKWSLRIVIFFVYVHPQPLDATRQPSLSVHLYLRNTKTTPLSHRAY